MSVNAVLNATIALIRGDMSLVRSILRAPGSDVKNVPEVVGKLVSALDEVRAEAIASYKAKVDADALVKELTAVQVDSLGIDYCQKYAGSQQERVAYMEGVAAVEDLITARIKKLKAGK